MGHLEASKLCWVLECQWERLLMTFKLFPLCGSRIDYVQLDHESQNLMILMFSLPYRFRMMQILSSVTKSFEQRPVNVGSGDEVVHELAGITIVSQAQEGIEVSRILGGCC